jgi:hypothetical protein
MLVSRLVPLLTMGGVALHSGPAIKERLLSASGIAGNFLTKQREATILESAELSYVAGGQVDFAAAGGFRAWVRQNVRLKNKGDPSLDQWGTPFHAAFAGTVLTITSAGADRQFGTKDDIQQSGNVADY